MNYSITFTFMSNSEWDNKTMEIRAADRETAIAEGRKQLPAYASRCRVESAVPTLASVAASYV